jgi:hypothetical protein
MPRPEKNDIDLAQLLKRLDMPAQALEGAVHGSIHILGQIIADQQDTQPLSWLGGSDIPGGQWGDGFRHRCLAHSLRIGFWQQWRHAGAWATGPILSIP